MIDSSILCCHRRLCIYLSIARDAALASLDLVEESKQNTKPQWY